MSNRVYLVETEADAIPDHWAHSGNLDDGRRVFSSHRTRPFAERYLESELISVEEAAVLDILSLEELEEHGVEWKSDSRS